MLLTQQQIIESRRSTLAWDLANLKWEWCPVFQSHWFSSSWVHMKLAGIYTYHLPVIFHAIWIFRRRSRECAQCCQTGKPSTYCPATTRAVTYEDRWRNFYCSLSSSSSSSRHRTTWTFLYQSKMRFTHLDSTTFLLALFSWGPDIPLLLVSPSNPLPIRRHHLVSHKPTSLQRDDYIFFVIVCNINVVSGGL